MSVFPPLSPSFASSTFLILPLVFNHPHCHFHRSFCFFEPLQFFILLHCVSPASSLSPALCNRVSHFPKSCRHPLLLSVRLNRFASLWSVFHFTYWLEYFSFFIGESRMELHSQTDVRFNMLKKYSHFRRPNKSFTSNQRNQAPGVVFLAAVTLFLSFVNLTFWVTEQLSKL